MEIYKMEDFNKDPMDRYYTTQKEDLERVINNKVRSTPKGETKSWTSVLEKIIAFNTQEGKVTVPYTQVPLVRIAVDKIATAIGSVPYEFYEGDNEIYDNPIIKLLNKPNRYINSLNELFSISSIFLNIKGECFWYYRKSLGQMAGTSTIPSEIVLLDPDKMRTVIQDGELVGWIYDNKLPLTNDDVTHFKFFNIYNIFRGISKLESAMVAVDTDYRAAKYNQRLFSNSAEPGVVIELAVNAVDPTKEEKEHFIQMWNKRHQGDANQNKLAITPPGAVVKTLGFDHRQMQFYELRKNNREEVLGVYGVPLGVCFTETLTYATAIAQRKQFWIDTIIPICRMQFEAALNNTLYRIYAPNLTGWFNFDEISELQEDFKSKADIATKYFQMGIPLSDINERLDLGFDLQDPIYDVSYIPISMVPAGTPAEPTPTKALKDIDVIQVEPVKETKLLESAFVKSFRSKFDRRQKRVEELMHKKLKRWFFEERGKVLSIVDKSKSIKAEHDNILYELGVLFNKQKKEITTFMKGPMTEAVKEGFELANETLGLSIDFNINSHVTQAIMNRRANYITGIPNSTYRLVQGQIHEAINNGETIDQIAERVRSIYNSATSRSLAIARTETCSVISDSSMEEYRANNCKEKVWIATHDDVTRESHIQNEVEGPIGIDEKFSATQQMFPGDPAGGPSEAINCRCCVAPHIEE
jgi:HK97 family phage portal protein